MLREQHDRREADHEGQQVEVADEARRVEHRLARLLRVRHREEAHQDVREAGRAEHQRDAERQRVGRVADQLAGPHDRQRARMHGHRAAEHRVDAEAELAEREHREQRRAAQQQHGLDHLHPGGRGHPAEEHVDDHQHADDQLGRAVRQPEQQLDQLARADHLHDEVQHDDGQRVRRRQQPDRPLREAVRDDVDERELAEVAQRFGDQEHHERPADQEADRIDQPVEAEHEHHPRQPEERRGRHVVAGDREPVLQPGDAAAGRVEVARRAGAARGPARERERREHEREEHRDRDRVQLDLVGHRAGDTGRMGGGGDENGQRAERARNASHAGLRHERCRIASTRRSNARFARST